jgi:cytochrome P450
MRNRLPFTNPGAYQPGELFAFYNELHSSAASSFYDGGSGLQVIWRHVDVSGVLLGQSPGVTNANSLDPLTPVAGLLANPGTWRHLAYLMRNVTPATANAAGPAHESVRRVVIDRHDRRSINPVMTRQHYASLVQDQVDEAAAALGRELASGQADFARVFAGPLAAKVIGRVLGFLPETAQAIEGWAHGQASLLGRRMRGGELAAAVAALAALSRACRELIGQRASSPGDDLGTLLAQPGAGRELPSKRAASAAMNLIAAGYITTYGTLLNSLACLLSPAGRGHWDALADPACLPGLTSEMLRRETALTGWKRKAHGQVVLADGSVIPAGRQILALIGAANCDPGVFANPEVISPGRKVSGKELLTFGIGAHSCVGSGLATLELELSLRTLREAFPGLRLAGPPSGYAPDNLFRIPDALPVTASS